MTRYNLKFPHKTYPPSLSRSLANLVAHKRSFCLERYEEVNHVYSSKAGAEAASLQTVIVEGEMVETVIPEDNTDTENYSPSLGRSISETKLWTGKHVCVCFQIC